MLLEQRQTLLQERPCLCVVTLYMGHAAQVAQRPGKQNAILNCLPNAARFVVQRPCLRKITLCDSYVAHAVEDGTDSSRISQFTTEHQRLLHQGCRTRIVSTLAQLIAHDVEDNGKYLLIISTTCHGQT